MAENIMSLLNKLSSQIVSEELENYSVNNSLLKNDKYFKKCVNLLRRKGCDVLLNKERLESLKDPCQTEYGGNWSPFILLGDYERELKSKRIGKFSEILHNSLEAVREKEYDCVNELLKFLLLLKKPFLESSVHNQLICKYQNEAAFSGSDFLLGMLDSLSQLTVNYTTDRSNASGSNKKALYYEESWTKNFDGGFELLGEYSKKSLRVLEKGSLNSLFICRSNLNKSLSQSSAFVLADFFTTKNQKQNSLLAVCNNMNENVLDKLVDNPINHKLPDMNFQSKFSIKSGVLEKFCDESSKKEPLLQTKKSQSFDSNEMHSFVSDKSSAIDLKRNSNCCHSFSILHGKNIRNSQESNSLSDENLSVLNKKPFGGAKDIIIGLWEEQHELLKEFRPELENCFPKLRMISVSDYVEDVKYLFTGVNNGTFHLDPNERSFRMVYGTCLQDVTPESLYHFSKTFLDVGNNYLKLIERVTEIGRNNFDVCKTVSQAFWKSIFDFLELHYALVLEIPSNINLMALKFSTIDLREMIMSVAEICKISDPVDAMPEGGQLLTYLLQVAEKVSKTCVRSLVFGIIRNCCNVYFMCILQTWMFQGSAECDNGEFFVSYKRPKMKTRTRCYYNSFYINYEKVPSFLQGFEENIFSCGKSIHFLKLFNKEDKFSQLLDKTDYPSMYPCFTEEDIEELKLDFEYYEKRVLRECGKSISIKAIQEEKKEKERKYLEHIKECRRRECERRALERRKLAEQIKMKKIDQAKQLSKCWKEVKEEQKRKKEALKLEQQKAEAEAAKKAAETEEKVKEEAALIKNYYEEKMEALDRRITLAEVRKEDLIHILTKLENNPADMLDNKIQLDVENNITGLVMGGDQVMEIKEAENKTTESKAGQEKKPETDAENNVVADLNRNTSGDSIFYDVNSNPTSTKDIRSAPQMHKSVSYRRAAAEEAQRNKFKVLRSEFDLRTKSEHQDADVTETRTSLSRRDLEKSNVKAQSSEYSLLKRSKANSGTCVNILKRYSSPFSARDVTFETINLDRKNECVNLDSRHESEGIAINATSLGSIPSKSENYDGVETTPAPSSMILNELYQKALGRDAEIFQRRMTEENIFCGLEKEQLTKLPCKDFMQFQRYLRKSALVPLKIQEKLANDALLKQLLLNENLLSHLNSLRGYFFLNDGEFGRSFTHHTFRSLAKCTEPGQFFERSNLSNIVNEALNYTIHNDEPNAQNLSFQITKMPPFLNHASHDVLSPFELSYKADWPLNIILTEKALSKYKTVFQFLLKLKRINWTLNENYLHLNSYFKTKKLDGKWFRSSHYHKIQIYRHAMTQVMITLDDYIFSNGIQFPWICFQKDLDTTENIDHLYQKHVRYMKDVFTRCFLSKDSEELLDCLHNLIEIALKFHYTTKSSSFELIDGKLSHPKYKVLKLTFTEFCTVIKNFLRVLKEKISTNQVAKSHYVLIEKFDLKLT